MIQWTKNLKLSIDQGGLFSKHTIQKTWLIYDYLLWERFQFKGYMFAFLLADFRFQPRRPRQLSIDQGGLSYKLLILAHTGVRNFRLSPVSLTCASEL